jgi:hypothetical protein
LERRHSDSSLEVHPIEKQGHQEAFRGGLDFTAIGILGMKIGYMVLPRFRANKVSKLRVVRGIELKFCILIDQAGINIFATKAKTQGLQACARSNVSSHHARSSSNLSLLLRTQALKLAFRIIESRRI